MSYLTKMFFAFGLLQAHMAMSQTVLNGQDTDINPDNFDDFIPQDDGVTFDEPAPAGVGASSKGKRRPPPAPPANDDGKDDAPLIADKEKTYEDGCKTAFVKGSYSQCFQNMKGCYPRNQWGWSNLIRYTQEDMGLYINGDDCQAKPENKVGTVRVKVLYGKVYLTLSTTGDYTISEWRAFVEKKRAPVRQNKYRSSPFSSAFKKFSYFSKSYSCQKPATYTWLVVYVKVCKKCIDANPNPIIKVIGDDADWEDELNKPLTAEDISEGMIGWTLDDMETRLYNFPPVYQQPSMKAYFPFQQDGIPAQQKFKFYCPKNCDNKPCEIIVTHYHCPPCSGDTNGNLPHLLPNDGWTPAHCGPRFVYSIEKYDTTAFRITLPSGTEYETPAFDRTLSNTAIYMRPGATDCDALERQSKCEASDECEFDYSENSCFSNWCPPAPRGPPRTCEPCAPTRQTQ